MVAASLVLGSWSLVLLLPFSALRFVSFNISDHVHRLLGAIPNRIALAGGWIDQPFVSRHNPKPPGSMVVVSLQPTFRVMDRAGCASGTRAVAMQLWKGRLPKRPADERIKARAIPAVRRT
jgi:hypothetical protein